VGDSGDAATPRHLELWTRPPNCSANHIPYNQPVYSLLTANNFSAQTRMDSGPDILSRISTEIGADAPDDELLRLGRPFEYVRVVAVEATLQLDDRDPPSVERTT
jgi:hypothetical protein